MLKVLTLGINSYVNYQKNKVNMKKIRFDSKTWPF